MEENKGKKVGNERYLIVSLFLFFPIKNQMGTPYSFLQSFLLPLQDIPLVIYVVVKN